MNIRIIKSMAMAAAMILTSYASFALGDGTVSNPYTVCAASGYKLTASASIASGSTVNASGYKWIDDGGNTLSETSANLTVAAPATAVTTSTTLHYKVEASSTSAGCYSDPQDIYVILVPAPTLTAPTLAAICAWNSSTTSATASIITLAAPTSSAPSLPTGVTIGWGSWTGSTGTGAITATGSAGSGTATTPSPQNAGTYTYSITSGYAGLNVGNGAACAATSQASIIINPLPTMGTSGIAGL